MTEPKILFLDIETAPAVCFTFSLWKPVIGMDQIIEPSRIIAWSAQWHGSKKTMFMSEYHDDRESMLREIHGLMSESQVIVGYNSKRFDYSWLTGEFILEGLTPLPPIHHVDLYQVAKSNMRLLSGKLDYLSLRLLDDRKVAHTGFKLWRDCLIGDVDAKAKAWKLMRTYSIKDTALMLPIFDILRPWIKTFPNMGLFAEPGAFVCSKCGSADIQRRGYARSSAGVFPRFQCNACSGWSKSPVRISTTELRPA